MALRTSFLLAIVALVSACAQLPTGEQTRSGTEAADA